MKKENKKGRRNRGKSKIKIKNKTEFENFRLAANKLLAVINLINSKIKDNFKKEKMKIKKKKNQNLNNEKINKE